jgi:hypothetical protein
MIQGTVDGEGEGERHLPGQLEVTARSRDLYLERLSAAQTPITAGAIVQTPPPPKSHDFCHANPATAHIHPPSTRCYAYRQQVTAMGNGARYGPTQEAPNYYTDSWQSCTKAGAQRRQRPQGGEEPAEGGM